MASTIRWTSADLELLPDREGLRYEIIGGELYMSRQPHYYHQYTCGQSFLILSLWSKETGLGQVSFAPGLVFAEDDDVIPDLVWISNERLALSLGKDGHLHTAPELVIEVTSPGFANRKRDRETKLRLYSRRGVDEYWIVDWQTRQIEVYRRHVSALHCVATLCQGDVLNTPLLPGFSCSIDSLFAP